MSLFGKRYVGGFMDQIRCDEPSYLVWKWHPSGLRQGENNRENDKKIDTSNFPVLASIVGLAYEGGTPFQAEIYFINLARIVQVRFAVPFFDVYDPRFDDFGVPVAVRGTISFQIKDYREFIKKRHGS